MKQNRTPTYLYLTDEKTGEVVRIPEDKLEQYQMARQNGTPKASEEVKRRMLELLKRM